MAEPLLRGAQLPSPADSSSLPFFVRLRALFACTVLLAILAGLAGWLFYIQIICHEEYADQARDQLSRFENCKKCRGDLRDINGVVLATTPSLRNLHNVLAVDWHQLKTKLTRDMSLKTLLELGALLSLPADQVEFVLRRAVRLESADPYCQYIRVENNVSETQSRKIRAYRRLYGKTRGKAWQRAVKLERRSGRRYTFADRAFCRDGIGYYRMCREILGTVAPDGHGIYGAEGAFDRLLQGRSGIEQRFRAGTGAICYVPEDGIRVPPVEPCHVYLTIDVRLQKILWDAVREGYRRCNALKVSALIMDPYTGRLLAFGTWPRQAQSEAIFGLYEPGSVFKCFVAAEALIRGKAALDGGVIWKGGNCRYVPGRRRPVRDVHDVGAAGFEKGFVRSSNVVFSIVAERLGASGMRGLLERFELTGKLSVGSALWPQHPGEEYRVWKVGDRLECRQNIVSMGFGTAVHVSMASLARAYSALVNGGYLPAPHIHYGYRAAESGKLRRFKLPRPERIIYNSKVLADINYLLEEVVENEHGTAHALKEKAPGVAFGGKTGTAKKYNKEFGGYNHSRFYTGTFIAHAPLGKPRYVVIAKVEVDRRTSAAHRYFGGSTAGPVVASILRALYRGPVE